MLDNQIKERFVELRAQGRSYCAIAAELNVSKTTLIQWSKTLTQEIANLKAIELDALQEQYYAHKSKRIQLFGEQIERIKQELASRDLKCISTERLFDLFSKFVSALKLEEVSVKFNERTDDFDSPADVFKRTECWEA